ncbi:Glyoxalase-like domain protein [Aquisphaera giovannonii]|uniref:Glyoxalase-like domain protein n=1 Tax=Aquisphaera giovannonii TaxID=406548 RepID=A0A5B9VUJ3_9BACT|nr:VOC family protein [Aquisphaera giovannonii]QEH32053.1 Glyoxalase-like domain protein [Aquisphaera giovannonii]
MRTKLATINLQVADPQRSRRFYEDVLGMVEDARRSHPPSFVYLRSDGCDLTLATPPESSGAQPSRTIELGFLVDDIEAMKSHLSARGIRDHREESMGWGRALELRDEDGYRIVIYSFERAGGVDRR